MSMRLTVKDIDKCIGCQSCMFACARRKGEAGLARSSIGIRSAGGGFMEQTLSLRLFILLDMILPLTIFIILGRRYIKKNTDLKFRKDFHWIIIVYLNESLKLLLWWEKLTRLLWTKW